MVPVWSEDAPKTLPCEGFPVETLTRRDGSIWSGAWQPGGLVTGADGYLTDFTDFI